MNIEEKKGFLSGALAGLFAGVLWAVLYASMDTAYGLGIALVHLAGGCLVSAAVIGAARVARGLVPGSPAAVAGASLGALWCAPILLFVIDYRFFDITVGLNGLAFVVFLGGFCLLAGAAVTSLGASRGTLAAVLVGALFSTSAPLVSYALLSGPPAPTITIADRISETVPGLRDNVSTRVMVLGIDGGTWDVILPMIARGKLPVLRSLMDRGRYGILSSVPTASGATISPAIWTSIFTGLEPQRHGIDDWYVSDSRNRKRKALWNILNSYGETTITVNIPGTFPPEVVSGAMISGFPIPGVVKPSSQRFYSAEGRYYSTRDEPLHALPQTRIELRPSDRAADAVGSFSPPLAGEIPLTASIEMQHGRLRHRAYDLRVANLFIELAERRGLCQIRTLSRLPFVVQDSTDDGKRNYDTVRLFPSDVEREPALLRSGEWTPWLHVSVKGVQLSFKARLMNVSADGLAFYVTPLFQSSSKPVIPYTYPLRLASRLSERVGQYVVEGAGWSMVEDEVVRDALYEHTAEVGATRARAAAALLDEIPNWSLFVQVFTESDRIQHPFWGFHRALRDGEDPDGASELADRHGDKVEAIYEQIDVQIGELLSRHSNEHTTIVIVSDHGFGSSSAPGQGEHTLDGIYILAGKNILRSDHPPPPDPNALERASALDITPTLLYLMGYPAARDLDGKVMRHVIDAAYESAHPLRWIETYEAGETRGEQRVIDPSTIEQLKSLGYVK